MFREKKYDSLEELHINYIEIKTLCLQKNYKEIFAKLQMILIKNKKI